MLQGYKTYIASALTLFIQFCVAVGWIDEQTGNTLTQAGLALIGMFLAAKINRKGQK
jgi:hypothetical protein